MYLVLFGVGAGFIVISLIVGEMAEVEGSTVFSFFRPTLIAVFMVVMGGVGLILSRGFAEHEFFGWDGIVLFSSVVSALVVSGLINRFILIPMYRAQNTSTFNIQDTIGVCAEVISPIPQGGYGKIRYNISGSTVTSPAKSDDGNPIATGENVDIIYVEKNTYFVRKSAEGQSNGGN
ncbi:MAG: hypothetical protein FWB80_05605 [Defluviitaleaceae bacterium]|nr:hypothetical protein [Defluviitaleaceae bacterium]